MSGLLALVDTNILVYSDDKNSPSYPAIKNFLEENLPKGVLAIAQQNICEFYAITTDSRRTSHPQTPADRILKISAWLQSGLFKTIGSTENTPATIIKLLTIYPAKGQEIFDVYLAATMIDNGIRKIYTADPKIFSKLGLQAINPLK